MIKRVISAAVVLLVIMTMGLSAAGAFFTEKYVYDNRFEDVQPSNWYYYSVVRSFELGIINGVSQNRFDNSGTVTTAQAVTMVARLHSLYYRDTEEFPEGERWYTGAVQYAIENRIVGSGIWEYLGDNINRAKFFQIISDALPNEMMGHINYLPEGELAPWTGLPYGLFPDLDADSIYAPAIYRLYQAGIVIGDSQGVRMNDTITRAETATLLTRIAEESQRVFLG